MKLAAAVFLRAVAHVRLQAKGLEELVVQVHLAWLPDSRKHETTEQTRSRTDRDRAQGIACESGGRHPREAGPQVARVHRSRLRAVRGVAVRQQSQDPRIRIGLKNLREFEP